ncbi:MAG: hypothetical protein KAR11_01840 [Phycisphaerae bacterium]|nr:hypothetical protein [Phycisphaerae bacterium]
MKSREKFSWSDRETEQLIKLYPSNRNKDLAKKFSRTLQAIRGKARTLNLKKVYANKDRLPRGPRLYVWSKNDIEKLKKLYPHHSNKYIAQKIGRAVRSVASKAEHLRLRKAGRFFGPKWKTKEVNFLKKSYNKMTYPQIAEKIGRSVGSVVGKAIQLGITFEAGKYWTKKEDNVIRRYYGKLTAAQVAEKLDRTATAVKGRAKRLGVYRINLWTKKEAKLLKKHYLTHTYEELAEIIGRSRYSVVAKSRQLELSQTLL